MAIKESEIELYAHVTVRRKIYDVSLDRLHDFIDDLIRDARHVNTIEIRSIYDSSWDPTHESVSQCRVVVESYEH